MNYVSLSLAPLQPNKLSRPASLLVLTQGDASLCQGFPAEEDTNSDQTIDYLGESSDESVDWAMKATQEFHYLQAL